MAIAAALIGAGGSLLSGIMGSRASRRAADKAAGANREAIRAQERMYEEAREFQQPFYDTGTNALNALAYQFGVGPQPGTDAMVPQITTRTVPGASRRSADDTARNVLNSMRGNGPADPLRAFLLPRQSETTTPDRTVYMVGDKEFGTRQQAEAYRQSLISAQPTYDRVEAPVWDTGTRADIGNAMMADGQAGVSVRDGNVFFDPSAGFESSPGFEFMRDESEEALSRMAAARGLRLSGGTLEEAQRNAMGLAQQDYWNYFGNNAATLEGNFNRNLNDEIRGFNSERTNYNDQIGNLFRLAGMGQNAASLQGSGLMSLADNTANLMQQTGQTQAAGIMGQNYAMGNALDNFQRMYGMGMFDDLGAQQQSRGSGYAPATSSRPMARPF